MGDDRGALLERALEWASRAHAGQKDKAGEPYVLHLLRVCLAVDTDTERVVALLHDILEDTPTTQAELDATFGMTVGDAVAALTRRASEDYETYIRRVKANLIARRVKHADLLDNMNLTRLPTYPNLTDRDAMRYQKYQRALRELARD